MKEGKLEKVLRYTQRIIKGLEREIKEIKKHLESNLPADTHIIWDSENEA